MRARLTIVVAAAAAALAASSLAPASSTATPFRARLIAPTHAPQVNTRWTYSVILRDLDGRPIRGALRVYVYERGRRIDTVGWYGIAGKTTRTMRWHPSLRGRSLVFRVVVLANKSRANLDYWIKPR